MNAKICPKCNETKDNTEFAKRGNRKQPYCKPCNREYNKQHYINNKQKYLQDAKQRRTNIRRRSMLFIMDYAKSGCELCGEKDFRCLEFDHIDRNNKSFNISAAMSSGASNKKLLNELHKCRILCANCHRKHTSNQMNWYNLVKN